MSSGINILSVDRDKVIRSLIETCVEVLDAKVVGVETGVKALELLEAEDRQFDLIVTEMILSHMDGVEFMHKVKENAASREIPIIVVSSVTEEDRIVAAMQAGAREYITKPFSSEVLLTKIVSTLGLEQAE